MVVVVVVVMVVVVVVVVVEVVVVVVVVVVILTEYSVLRVNLLATAQTLQRNASEKHKRRVNGDHCQQMGNLEV